MLWKNLLRKPNLLKNQTCLDTNQGVFRKKETNGYLNMNFKNHVTNVEYVWMSLKVSSKLNIPGIPPTWKASTWSSRCGQLIWMTVLDSRGLLWPGAASWPLHKTQSAYTEVLTTSNMWLGFEILRRLADLCHIHFFLSYLTLSKHS